MPCIVLHDNRHGAEIEAISLRHHSLSETVGNMVGAQKRRYHNRNMDWNQGEYGCIPTFEDETLELEVRELATGQNAPGVARLADRGLNEWRKVSTAF